MKITGLEEKEAKIRRLQEYIRQELEIEEKPREEDGWFSIEQYAEMLGITVNQFEYRVRKGPWRDKFEKKKVFKHVYYKIKSMDDTKENATE